MAETSDRILRFTLSDRIEHTVQMLSFTGLAISGLVQRFADGSFSDWIIGIFGGIEQTRKLHHVLATILLLSVVYHLGVLGYKRFVLDRPRALVPGKADLGAVLGWIRFNTGLEKHPPTEGRYTVGEKIEYWSLVWGTVLMAMTGFMLWNPIATTRFLPGVVVPAAKAAHGWEAVLAVLAILVWHFYDVHWRHFNASIFTGYASRALMEEHHSLELAAIEAGEYGPSVSTELKRSRALRYWPAFAVLAGILLVGVYLFVSFEQTAITTIVPPPLAGPIYTPLPTTTTAPTTTTTGSSTTTAALGDVSWDGGVSTVFEAACGSCHSGSAPASGLDVSSLAGLLAGGASGEPGIVAGDADAGRVIVEVGDGSHFGKFSDADLALVKGWISAGAPES